MEITRRSFMTEPGEPLLIAQSPIAAAIRFGTWLEEAGLPARNVLSSPLSAVPLPIYPASWDEGSRRWPGVRPEAMWHPLMWLPDRVAKRYNILYDNKEPVLEDDDTWAVRVALELTASGMYDETSGTWMDVLSLVGLDPDNDADLSRVSEWLAGANDDLLDSIDLAEHMDNPDDLTWALSCAVGMVDDLRLLSWALTADDLLDVLDDLVQGRDDEALDEGRARWVGAVVARIAQSHFSALETMDGKPEEDYWAGMQKTLEFGAADLPALLEGPISEMFDRLKEIREQYWPLMETLAEDVPPTGIGTLVPALSSAAS